MKIIYFLLCFIITSNLYAENVSIVAQVNNYVITDLDVKNRIKILAYFDNKEANKKFIDKNFKKVLSELIEERVYINHALELGMNIDNKTINMALSRLFGSDIKIIKQAINQQNLSLNSLINNIKARIAREQIIGKQIMPQITVSNSDIIEKKESLINSSKVKKIKISEISINIDNENNYTNQKLKTIISKLKQGEDFALIAKEYSDSPNHANGGKLGWFNEDQLSKQILHILKNVRSGEYSKPFENEGKIQIIKIDQIKNVNIVSKKVFDETNLDIKHLFTNNKKKYKEFKKVVNYINHCDDVKKIEKKLKYIKIYDVKGSLKDFNPKLYKMLYQHPINQPTKIFNSRFGKHSLIICNKKFSDKLNNKIVNNKTIKESLIEEKAFANSDSYFEKIKENYYIKIK